MQHEDPRIDAAMALLTTHHWTAPTVGLDELRRVSNRQVVWYCEALDPATFWPLRYFRAASGLPSVTAAPGEAMIRDIAAGVGKPALSFIPPGMPGFQADLGKDIVFDATAASYILRFKRRPYGHAAALESTSMPAPALPASSSADACEPRPARRPAAGLLGRARLLLVATDHGTAAGTTGRAGTVPGAQVSG